MRNSEKLWFGSLSTIYIGLNFNHFTNKQKNVYWFIGKSIKSTSRYTTNSRCDRDCNVNRK